MCMYGVIDALQAKQVSKKRKSLTKMVLPASWLDGLFIYCNAICDWFSH